LLTITANQEAEYQKVLAANQAKAAAIRAALFPLRDAGSIQFGDALRYAQSAGAKTGVRPALILAFLSQESNLGANVGQCYLKDDVTGAGVGKNTGTPFAKVMKPDRDVAPFIALSKRLGFDPHSQVVSCPQSVGYGGAMGPAQFIPSTWVLFEARIAAATGNAVPNPWGAQDAIMANALYIADLGAGAGGYTAESEAACHYFSGSSCSASALVAGYGRSVVAKADAYQKDIDFLSDN
jgi:membrane-bound lytic murein transglycosylase B